MMIAWHVLLFVIFVGTRWTIVIGASCWLEAWHWTIRIRTRQLIGCRTNHGAKSFDSQTSLPLKDSWTTSACMCAKSKHPPLPVCLKFQLNDVINYRKENGRRFTIRRNPSFVGFRESGAKRGSFSSKNSSCSAVCDQTRWSALLSCSLPQKWVSFAWRHTYISE